MDATALPHHLRRLRDAQGLTQAELAERAGLSRVAYGQIEAGAASPRVATLLRLAAALGVKLPQLLAPVTLLQAVRFRADRRMNRREQILADVARWLADFAELESLLDQRRDFALGDLGRRLGRRADRPRRAAAMVRQLLGLGSDEPIRDLAGFLEERAGIKVYPLRLASEDFFGLSVGQVEGGPAIVVNVWDRISVERWIFTAAHELGHLLLHLDAYDVDQAGEDVHEEQEADQFASQLLLPEAVFQREWSEARGLPLVERVLKVKRIFRVSYKTVLYRLSESPRYGKGIWDQFRDAYHARSGRRLGPTDEPEGLDAGHFQATMVEPRAAGEPSRLSEEDFVEDRLSRLVRAALEKELISVGRGAEILGLDLRQMRRRMASWVE